MTPDLGARAGHLALGGAASALAVVLSVAGCGAFDEAAAGTLTQTDDREGPARWTRCIEWMTRAEKSGAGRTLVVRVVESSPPDAIEPNDGSKSPTIYLGSANSAAVRSCGIRAADGEPAQALVEAFCPTL